MDKEELAILKQYCIDNDIVNKNFFLNSRKKSDSVEIKFLIEKFQAPAKVAIDIIFKRDGIIPKCSYCGGVLDLRNLSNFRPLNYSHKECVRENKHKNTDWEKTISKRKKTCLEKYGDENFCGDLEANLIKVRKTKKERYGDENYANHEKNRLTKLLRYGDEKYRNSDKIKNTCLERYGSENPFGSKIVIERATKTLEETYGGRGFASEKIASAVEDSNLRKFGVKNAMTCKEVSNKSRDRKRKLYYKEELYDLLTRDLGELHSRYLEDNSLSIARLAASIGVNKKTLARNFMRSGFEILDRRYSSSTSYGETYLCNLIREMSPGCIIENNTRKIIQPKEIDVWLPEHNIGIEYHGSYWHREERVSDQHRDKAIMAREAGVRLIQIFDYEIVEKTEIVLSIIRNALGRNEYKIPAKKCAVKTVSVDESRIFCEENHIQGYSGAKINLGLYTSDDELIQILSFGSPRFSSSHEWEIIRSCTKKNYVCMGGFEKLWSYFVKEYKPNSVISYADARFFTGNSYHRVGFELKEHTNSGYIWSNGANRISRYKTQKAKLVSKDKTLINKTESQIMNEKGFFKILDAGMLVYTWKNNLYK
jgi:hypothetical protein